MKILNIILSIPKTIYFNFYFLPFHQAIKFPIWLKYNTFIKMRRGGVNIDSKHIKTAMIRIGFHKVPICDSNAQTILDIEKKGKLIFKGTAHIGNGTKIHIANGAQLILDDNFAVSASSQLNCYKKISFGRDIQFSWDCLVMDSDTHHIIGESGNIINEAREIIFGDQIWIGCRTTILKGSIIPNNCVIGACSLVSGNKFEPNTIIVGNPAKSTKKINRWHL